MGIAIDFDIQALIRDLTASAMHPLSEVNPSVWAEQNRYLSSEMTEKPGKFDYSNTPYLKEIVDFYAPDSPYRVGAFMKAAQIGNTRGVIENAIGWIIDTHPGNIQYLVGHEDLLAPSVQKMDKMIDACGIRHLIRSSIKRARRTKSGDTDTIKEFPNGYLRLGIVNHKSLRNEDFVYGFIDDYEAMKGATKEAGATANLIMQRYAAHAHKMRLMFMSSPELKGQSNIEEVFEMGDQRYWHIPCPLCGEKIIWFWETTMKDDPEKVAGITYDIEDGELVPGSVGYKCQECGGVFDDRHKMKMLNEGEFIATAKPTRPDFVSWHVSALYAPTFMQGWEWYVRQYLDANPYGGDKNEPKEKAFYNLVLGMTYEEKSEEIDATQLQMNIRKYEIGTVPEKVSINDGSGKIVLLTIAADLNGIVEDARLDWEVVAWAESGSTYSIAHGSIGTFVPRENTRKKKEDRERWTYAHTAQRSVWGEFDKLVKAVYETDTGRRMRIFCGCIDVGHYDQYAWQYIDNCNSMIYGVKGEGVASAGMKTTYLPTEHNQGMFKIGKARENLYISNVNLIKDALAMRMKLKFDPNIHDQQPAGFLNFPQPSGGLYLFDNYFCHFEAEKRVNEKRGDGTVIGAKWVKTVSTAQNHFFDVAVMHMVSREIFLRQFFKEMSIINGGWADYCESIKKAIK